MTTSQLIDIVEDIIKQDLAGDTLTITRTMVKVWLNIAYRKLVAKVVKTGADRYLTEYTDDLVANQSIYSLTDDTSAAIDVVKIQRVELMYSGSTYTKAEAMRRNAPVSTQESAFSTTYPFYSTESVDGVYLVHIYPTPSANYTSGIKVFLHKYPAALSGDSDVCFLPIGADHLPAYYAAAKSLMSLGLMADHDRWMSTFATEEAEMIQDLTPDTSEDASSVDISDL